MKSVGKIGNGIAKAAEGAFVSFNSVVTLVTLPVNTVRDNYKHNSQYQFTDYIYDQGKPSQASNLKMGYATADWNGCGWIATYNVARLLDMERHPADIIKYYETHGGMIADGAFGVTPLAVETYFNQSEFKKAGITTGYHYFPGEVDNLIKNSDFAIVNYVHGSGMHYIAVEYKDGTFYTMNDGQMTESSEDLPSLDALLKRRGNTVFTIITINK